MLHDKDRRVQGGWQVLHQPLEGRDASPRSTDYDDVPVHDGPIDTCTNAPLLLNTSKMNNIIPAFEGCAICALSSQTS